MTGSLGTDHVARNLNQEPSYTGNQAGSFKCTLDVLGLINRLAYPSDTGIHVVLGVNVPIEEPILKYISMGEWPFGQALWRHFRWWTWRPEFRLGGDPEPSLLFQPRQLLVGPNQNNSCRLGCMKSNEIIATGEKKESTLLTT